MSVEESSWFYLLVVVICQEFPLGILDNVVACNGGFASPKKERKRDARCVSGRASVQNQIALLKTITSFPLPGPVQSTFVARPSPRRKNDAPYTHLYIYSIRKFHFALLCWKIFLAYYALLHTQSALSFCTYAFESMRCSVLLLAIFTSLKINIISRPLNHMMAAAELLEGHCNSHIGSVCNYDLFGSFLGFLLLIAW